MRDQKTREVTHAARVGGTVMTLCLWIGVPGAVLFWAAPDEPLPTPRDHRHGEVWRPSEVSPPRLVEATAYCPCSRCCGEWADGWTASGTRAQQGRTLAADPVVFPMGTCLSLPWVGERIVEDTGSAITGTRVDVYFDSHAEALRFGRQLLVAGRC